MRENVYVAVFKTIEQSIFICVAITNYAVRWFSGYDKEIFFEYD